MRRKFKISIFIFIVLCFLPKPEYASLGYTSGKVIDYLTKRSIPGAIITGNNEIVRTDNNGMFVIRNSTNKIGIRAYGYARAEQVIASPQNRVPLIGLKPLSHGPYISFLWN
jgi:hypothetical protein